MKTKNYSTISFIVSLILYNYFFWQESLGLNILLFAVVLISILFIRYRDSFRSLNVQITLAGTIVTASMVVVNNSFESKFAHIFSFMLMVAFIHESQLKSVGYALMHIVSSFLKVPFQQLKKRNESLKKFPKVYKFLRILRLSFIPAIIAIVFYLLYYLANPIFGEYASAFWTNFLDAFERFFSEISFARVLFILFGAMILSVVYFKNEAKIFLQRDLSFSEKLIRIRNYRRKQPVGFSSTNGRPLYMRNTPPFKSIALKNQNRRGVILLLMVNTLLLLVNFIDIKWLWLGFEVPENFSLTHYVREGVGYLIISIILSMVLLLYYFRRNQNFYSGNRMLRILAYVWILQNVILCASIFLRNYHYIDFHGLAYKRIGVYAFIGLTVFGLITLYNKIRNIRSAYYLVRINTWAVYVMFVVLSIFNWDVRIAKYNLAHWNKGEIDVDFYLKLSGKAMPVIYENLDQVKEQIAVHNNNKIKWIRNLDFELFKSRLDRKRVFYLDTFESRSWLSFNYADENARRSLLEPRQLSSRDR